METEKKPFSRLRAFNEAANDLPRKGLVILCVLLGVALFGALFRYIAPFVVALILSALLEAPVRFLSNKAHKIRIHRAIAALLCMLLVLSLLIFVISASMGRAVMEIKTLLTHVPSTVTGLVRDINSWIDSAFVWIDARLNIADESYQAAIHNWVGQAGRAIQDSIQTGLGPLANTVARGALVTAFSVPQILLFIVLSVLGTFYMVVDRERIIRYFHRLVPARARDLFVQMKSGMIRAVFGQVRAQVYLTMMMFTELLIGFSILGIPYALLLAMVIAIMDALPVVGSGLFLIPWSAIGFLTGNVTLGVGMILLYGITLIMRQLIEPRVVGAQLGVYPLATMMSMYAGFVLLGFLGMLAGPVTFLLCRVAVYAICGAPEEIAAALQAPPKRKRVVFIRK